MKGELLLFSIALLFLLSLSFISAPPPPPNATFENINVINNATIGNNLSATRGFFSFLGSAVSRITKGWFTDLDVINLVVSDLNVTNLLEVGQFPASGGSSFFKVDSIAGDIWMDTPNGLQIMDTALNEPRIELLSEGGGDPGTVQASIILDESNIFGLGSNSLIIQNNANLAIENFFRNKTNGNIGINTITPQNALNIIGATNSTGGFITGAFTGIIGNHSVGNCWFGINGGIITSTNCTAL